jgi:cytoskeletal protein CcmA (bactofilin family)
MWKREDEARPTTTNPTIPSAPAAPAAAPPTPHAEGPRERAVLGASLSVKGEVAGGEDLLVQGRIEGKIDLADHSVTIGRSGKVAADIFAKSVTVEGDIKGNLFATEQILIRKSGAVHGNLTAPRIVLEDGCKFKGSVDMESPTAHAQRGNSRPAAPPAPERPDRERAAGAMSPGAPTAAMPVSR